MKLFKSYSKENAVKVIAFAINYKEKNSLLHIEKLIDKLKENKRLKNDFNEELPQNDILITFNQDGIPKQENKISAIIFNKKEEDRILWTLILNKDSIIVTCRDYSRWDAISTQALDYIDIILNKIDSTEITQLTLEYLDEFEILKIESDWKKSLFKDNCEYITPNIYQLNDFWHISQGYFIKLNDVDEKILDTIDINYFADEKDNLKHKVNMRMQHKILYSASMPYNKENISNYFNKIHIHSKVIFFKIVDSKITDEFNIGELS